MGLLRSCLLTAALLGRVVCADWTITGGAIAVGDVKSEFGSGNVVHVDPRTPFEVSFQAKRDGNPAYAHQMMVRLVDLHSGIDFTYTARPMAEIGVAKVSIPQKSVPQALRAKELRVDVLVGSESGAALEQGVSTVNFASSETFVEPSRLGMKPELRHTFRGPPVHAPKVAAVGFAGYSVFAFFVVVVSWFFVLGTNLKALPGAIAASPFGHIGFLLSLGFLEYIFIDYYLGTSIFETVYKTAAVAVVATFTGSRSLREMRQRRDEGRL